MAIPWMNITNITSLPPTPHPSTSYLDGVNLKLLKTLTFLSYGILGQAMALFGIGTNIINIICFIKMGFKESINISLLSLAISDLCCLLTIIFTNVSMVLSFQEADLSFDPWDTQYLTTAIPHIMFTRITAVITAFITLERCLCITMPLKVKGIITSRRVAIINICIFVTLIISNSPIYFGSYLGHVYNSERNRTVLEMVARKHRVLLDQISFAINSVMAPSSALLIIIVCMIIMVMKLQRQAKWRKTRTTNTEASSEKEERLVKMIVMISVLFVVCFLPSIAILLLATIEPEFNVGGKYDRVSVCAYGFSTVVESANSSMNIFIYYRMSSRYRSYLFQCLPGKKELSNSEIKRC